MKPEPYDKIMDDRATEEEREMAVRCSFCFEWLIDKPKATDGTIDDMTHEICARCWGVINRKFKILGWTAEEIQA